MLKYNLVSLQVVYSITTSLLLHHYKSFGNYVSFGSRPVAAAVLQIKSVGFCYWSDSCSEKCDKLVLMLKLNLETRPRTFLKHHQPVKQKKDIS